MKKGYLSEYFKGIAAKRLSAVEANTAKSNQHEYNGITALKKIFGTEKKTYPTHYIYLDDNDDEPVTDQGYLTWYDARERHETRTEYRMYFPTTRVSTCASEGDELFVGLRPDDSILVVIAEGGSTICNQILWLFGLDEGTHPGFSIREELESEQDRIAFASRFILEQLGVEVKETEETYLDDMIRLFEGKFPTTRSFSTFARSTLPHISALDNPDDVLMAWMEREEILFRTLEKHIIAERLTSGFDGDVDGFISYSLSVQNRRKSRVGQALENHVEQIFSERSILYSRTPVTENKSKPDFIFPSIHQYRDLNFESIYLTMLGVKSTCKDRWRQVLTEANRIKSKHLLTLETAVSENQTNEMISNDLQLVVPASLHKTFSTQQQGWLLTLTSFIELVRSKQDTVM